MVSHPPRVEWRFLVYEGAAMRAVVFRPRERGIPTGEIMLWQWQPPMTWTEAFSRIASFRVQDSSSVAFPTFPAGWCARQSFGRLAPFFENITVSALPRNVVHQGAHRRSRNPRQSASLPRPHNESEILHCYSRDKQRKSSLSAMSLAQIPPTSDCITKRLPHNYAKVMTLVPRWDYPARLMKW